MKTFVITTLKDDDIDQLLTLQRDNLKSNLDAQTVDSQGFVSFVYSSADIKGMMEYEPQIIAKDENTLIGYALTAALPYAQTVNLLRPLVEKSKELTFNHTPLSQLRYYVMGQVCVKDGYRGIGVFDALYNGHKEHLSAQYDAVITEIATENKRSMAAHRRIGFTTIHTYYDDVAKKEWNIVIWTFKSDAL